MDSLDQIASIVGDTPYMTLRRAREIQETLESNLKRPLKRILEIGTFKGAGSCYLGQLGKLSGADVTTVDLMGNSARRNYSVQQLLTVCGLDNVRVVEHIEGAQGFFREHFLNNHPPYDFIYHDAAHNWTDATAIFSMAYAALSERGIMAIDDIRHKDYPDLTLMWEKVIPSLANKVVDPGYNLGWVLK